MQCFWNSPWSMCSIYRGPVCIGCINLRQPITHPCLLQLFCIVPRPVGRLFGARWRRSFSIYEPHMAQTNQNVSTWHNYDIYILKVKQLFRGTRLRVVSTSMSMKGRIRTARCEVGTLTLFFTV